MGANSPLFTKFFFFTCKIFMEDKLLARQMKTCKSSTDSLIEKLFPSTITFFFWVVQQYPMYKIIFPSLLPLESLFEIFYSKYKFFVLLFVFHFIFYQSQLIIYLFNVFYSFFLQNSQSLRICNHLSLLYKELLAFYKCFFFF